MKLIQKKLIRLNGRRLADFKNKYECEQWLNKYRSIAGDKSVISDFDTDARHQADYYGLAVEYLVGQLGLLDDMPIHWFLSHYINRADKAFSKFRFKDAYMIVHSASRIVKRAVHMKPVEAETWLTLQILRKQVSGSLYQLFTDDSCDINGMYVIFRETFGKKTPSARQLSRFLNEPFDDGSDEQKAQCFCEIINILMNDFLHHEHLFKEEEIPSFVERYSMICDPYDENKVYQFVQSQIADSSYADLISGAVLGSLRSIDDKDSRHYQVRGLQFAVNLFKPRYIKHCFNNSDDKEDDDIANSVGYFHTVMLMTDILSHHFLMPKAVEDKALISDSYYKIANCLHAHQFGPNA